MKNNEEKAKRRKRNVVIEMCETIEQSEVSATTRENLPQKNTPEKMGQSLHRKHTRM
jgi:hypothetical protein